jgi:hypothetical protein
MKTIIGSTAMAMFLAAMGSCNAQTVLKQEPTMMNRGAVVLVDDGSCPRGQIKQVSTELATGVVTNPYGAVTRKCIQTKGQTTSAVDR